MTTAQLLARFPDAEAEVLEMALDLLKPFEELVAVRCGERELLLPAGNSLWRGLQFWGMATGRLSIDFSMFCLAGNCTQCSTQVRWPEGHEETVLACRTEPSPGLEILALGEGFEFR